MDITNVKIHAGLTAIKGISTTPDTVIFGNFSNSVRGEFVYKIDSIVVSNIDPLHNSELTMQLYYNDDVFFYLALETTINTNSKQNLIDVNSFVYLPTGWSIRASSSREDALDCLIVYERLEKT